MGAGARVINISLGGSPANATLRTAISNATAAGVIIVFSAGNEFDTDPVAGANPDTFAQIANEPIARNLILIAGALNSGNNALTGFSNRAGNSAQHYLAALGSSVRTVDENGAGIIASGTSFSAPIVAGAIALLRQAFPALTPAQIIDLLKRSAIDLGAPGVDTTFGHGAIDIARAFAPQGATALPGSMIPISTVQSASTSAPMGDAAAKAGLGTVFIDGYGRAYSADLGGTIRRAPSAPRLAPALGLGIRQVGASTGATAVSLSVAGDGSVRSVAGLALDPRDDRLARALAGSIVTRLGQATSLAFGIARSGTTLARDLDPHSPSKSLISLS